MARLGWRSRCATLLLASAVGLHELRYASDGGAADAGGYSSRHAYLTVLAPTVALLLAVALGRVIALMASAGEDEARVSWSRRRLAVVLAVALLGLFLTQETLESLIAGAGLSGLGAAAGGSGWTVLPIAAGLGTVIAMVLDSAPGTLGHVAGLRVAWGRPCAPTPSWAIPRTPAFPRNPVARHLVGRGPPSISAV